MEEDNIMEEETFDRILKVAMLIAILFAIYKQIEIIALIYQEKEMLNANPLSYGAARYGITECSCEISESMTIWFNQSESKIFIRNSPVIYEKINFSLK